MNSQKFIGSSFEELSQEEMDFVTGANGGNNSEVQSINISTATVTVTPSSVICATAVSVSAVSAVAASFATDCM